jgi:hypothetical protein
MVKLGFDFVVNVQGFATVLQNLSDCKKIISRYSSAFWQG